MLRAVIIHVLPPLKPWRLPLHICRITWSRLKHALASSVKIARISSPSGTSKPSPRRVIPDVYGNLQPNHIRVLILHPGGRNATLRGHLIKIDLHDTNNVQAAAFEALSYVWGDAASNKQMVLNNKFMPISQNLYDALNHLRDQTFNRRIWIDAVCINQADTSERNQQVSMMGEIYSSAWRVVNWLGLPTTHTEVGMQMLTFFFGTDNITTQPPWTQRDPSLVRAVLNDILQRPYFKRVWVLQENALASEIMLQAGDHTLSWRSGAETHRAICRLKFTALSPSWETAGLTDIDFRPLLEVLEQNMTKTRQKLGKSCRQVTLPDLAYDMRYRKATDRRDMLYGLRNLVPDDAKKYIVVDYNKSVDELYEEFFEAIKKAYEVEIEFVEKSVKETKERRDATPRSRYDRKGLGNGW